MLWARGALVLDGPGNALYVNLARDYLVKLHRIPYWVPDMWGGSPVWALAPSFPIFLLAPLASLVGADVAVKAAVLALQAAGGLGVYVLARSLWGTRVAPVVSAVIYTLHPMIVSHGALLGAQAVIGVTAATPWIAWSLRLALQGRGLRYVAASGLLAAFAVLHQAEYALALVPLCLGVLLVELIAARRQGRHLVRAVLARMGAVVGIALGVAAHWLLPFLSLGKSFVLSPPGLVQGELNFGLANSFASEIGVFLHRPASLLGTVSFNRAGIVAESFYVSWVCLLLTAVTIVLLARRRGDPHLTAILLASGIVVWLSTGPVSLAESGPAQRNQVLALILTGALTGLLLGAVVRRFQGLRTRQVALGTASLFVVAMAFLTPFITLQRLVPLLDQFRFPRFYLLAVLGLALGAGYPLAMVERRAQPSTGSRGFKVPSAMVLGAAVIIAFVVDVFPVSSHYRVRPPDGEKAYAALAKTLAETGASARVASSTADPRSIASVLDAGAYESIGWPHPLAGRQLWRVTEETYVGPEGYREAALGLSSTALVAAERLSGIGGTREAIDRVELLRNPRVLPLVRSYEQAVVVAEPDLAPLLAVSLAYRNVGVVADRGDASRRLGTMPTARIGREQSCSGNPTSMNSLAAILHGEVALACAVDRWIDRLLAGTELIRISDTGAGARFVSGADGLRGVAVWLDRAPGPTELVLREVQPDGRTLGPELARSQAVGLDEYGLSAFTFDPLPGSAGRTFAFSLTCPDCEPRATPRMVVGAADSGRGDVIVGSKVQSDRVGAFTPIHDRLPAATVPGTRTTAQRTGPGGWKVDVDGPNPALLVVAETWFPGWKAKIDGREAPVLQADGAFLGVAVPAGRHAVTFSYHRPPAAALGRLITFVTLGGLGWAAWRQRRRRGDSGPGDSGPADSGPADSGPADSGPDDSAPDGDALEMGTPSVETPRQPGLQTGQSRPRTTISPRKRPRRH